MPRSAKMSIDVFKMKNMKIWANMSHDEWLEYTKGHRTLFDALNPYSSQTEKVPQTEDETFEDSEPEYIRERRVKKIIERNRQNIVRLVPPPVPQRTPRKHKFHSMQRKSAPNNKKMVCKSESSFKDNLTIAIAEEEKIKYDKLILEKKKKAMEDIKYLYNYNCAMEMLKLAFIDKSKKSNSPNLTSLNIENKEALKQYMDKPIIKTIPTPKSLKKTVRFEDNKENTNYNIKKYKGKSSKDFRSEAEEIEYEKFVAEHTETSVVKHELVDTSPAVNSWGTVTRELRPGQKEEYIVATDPEQRNRGGTTDVREPVRAVKRQLKTPNLKPKVEACIKNEGISNYEQELIKYKEEKQKLNKLSNKSEENVAAKNIIKSVNLQQGIESVWIKQESDGTEKIVKSPILKRERNFGNVGMKKEEYKCEKLIDNTNKVVPEKKINNTESSNEEYKFYETSDEDEIFPVTKRVRLEFEGSDSEPGEPGGSEDEYFRGLRKRKLKVESSSNQEQVEFKHVCLGNSTSNFTPHSKLSKVESSSDSNLTELSEAEVNQPLSDSELTELSEVEMNQNPSDSELTESSEAEINQSPSDSETLTELSGEETEQDSLSTSDTDTLRDSTELREVEIKQEPVSDSDMEHEHFTMENVEEWIKLEYEE